MDRKHDASKTTQALSSVLSNSHINFWFADVSANYMRVMIDDPLMNDNPVNNDYIEAGRIILGNALQPKYNMVWGMNTNNASQTALTRTRSGSMISNSQPVYRILNFTLRYMSETEAMELLDIFENPANKKDILISLFPDNTGKLGERTTILGRIVEHSAITITQYGWDCSITVEEAL